jgi:hypothetical protein
MKILRTAALAAILLLAGTSGLAAGCVYSREVTTEKATPSNVVVAPQPVERVYTDSDGRYELRGDGTASSPYHWVWIPSGVQSVPAPPPPPRFSGKRVALNLYALTPDQGFATEFATSRLEAKGAVVVGDAAKADLRLKVFARVLAVDQGQSFVGIPALVVPVLGYQFPRSPCSSASAIAGTARSRSSPTIRTPTGSSTPLPSASAGRSTMG